MRLHFFVLASVIATALLTSSAFAQDEDIETPLQPATLGDLPDIHLAPSPPPNDDKINRIKKLIDDLVEIDSPDYGLSPTLSGSNFAPLPGQRRAEVWTFADHRLKTSAALKALVELGPDALPFLVKALDDQRPTKLTIEHKGIFGAMWHGRELDVNPVTPLESKIVKQRGDSDAVKVTARFGGERVDEYTVKVGDVCFVIIGQIGGRSYRAVRYQLSACKVLNCPAHDETLRKYVRTIWEGDDGRSKLFDSLRADYATQFNGKTLNSWHIGNEHQCSAALRLMFYFPKESAALLAKRIDSLKVAREGDADGSMERAIANGVEASDFVKAVSWSQEPEIRAAVTRFFQRANLDDEIVAALPGVDDVQLIRKRLSKLSDRDDNPLAYHYLLALINKAPKTARDDVTSYLSDRQPNRCLVVCEALRAEKVAWDVDVLAGMLVDKHPSGNEYSTADEKDAPRLPVRLCDEAAVTLAWHHDNITFDFHGDHAALDEQIAEIRKKLGLE